MASQNPLEGLSPATSSPIRKSCFFCRSRKIRCSGGQVCTACRARNQGCVYGREASKGRPRGSRSASACFRGALQTELDGAALSNSPRGQTTDEGDALSSPVYFPPHQPLSKQWPTPVKTDFSISHQKSSDTKDLLFSTVLEDVFRRNFGPCPGPVEIAKPADSGSVSESDLLRPTGHNNISGSKVTSCVDNHPGLFPKVSPLLSLIQDLVELVSERFSSLGCIQRENKRANFVSSALLQDNTSTMFGNDIEPDSLPKYDDHQLCQMIELWVFRHPLSILVSKTLLLHSYRNETHDQVLLAVILGGACLALGGAESTQGDKFFHWADINLRRRRTGSPSISTAQILILLGWHELLRSNARRAFCYVKIARTSLEDIQCRCNDASLTGLDWINGIDVGKVELELFQRMYWFTSALDLWAAMQMNVPFDVQTAPSKAVSLPSMDKSVSAVYNLDERSGNSAALREQEKAMHELWPLSHVASTIGHIYALCPLKAAMIPAPPASGWESQILPRLRRLVDDPKSLLGACQSIRYILSDGIDALLALTRSQSSDFVVLSAYRILVVQFLFPRPDPGVSPEAPTNANPNDIIHFVGAFKDHAESLCQSPWDYGAQDLGSVETSLLVLGLDTCSRALHQLHISLKVKMTVEDNWSSSRSDQLTELASALHRICKYPRLRTASTLPMVKRHLKVLVQDFVPDGGPDLIKDIPSLSVDPFSSWSTPTLDPQMRQLTSVNSTNVFDLPAALNFDDTTLDWN